MLKDSFDIDDEHNSWHCYVYKVHSTKFSDDDIYQYFDQNVDPLEMEA